MVVKMKDVNDFKKSPFYPVLKDMFDDEKAISIDQTLEVVKKFEWNGSRFKGSMFHRPEVQEDKPSGFIIKEYFNDDETLLKLFLHENLVESCEVDITQRFAEICGRNVVSVSDLKDEDLEPGSSDDWYVGDLFEIDDQDAELEYAEIYVGSVFLTFP